MSHSTLYLLLKTKTYVIAEYKNSHLSAPLLWDHLWHTYVRPGERFPMTRESEQRLLWDLWKDEKVQPHHRLALQLTFDKAVLRHAKEDIVAMADALEKVHREMLGAPPLKFASSQMEPFKSPPSHFHDMACHLHRLTTADVHAQECESKNCESRRYLRVRHRAIGIGLGCTSVCDEFEQEWPTEGWFYINTNL